MKLLTIILNFRSTNLTVDCLRSLRNEVTSNPDFRVAVIENGSGDNAPDLLRHAIGENRWHDWVDLTISDVNLGFTGGNNRVIRSALASADPPEYFLLLNSDTRVEPGALGTLIDFMDSHPRAGIGGSTLLSAEGTVQPSPFRFGGILTEMDRGLRLGFVSKMLAPRLVTMPTPAGPCAVDWVSGASMVLRRSMLDEVGLLDEGLFTYYEDIDLCLRARRRGWETWFIPSSRVVHLEGGSSGITEGSRRRRPGYWFEARRRFLLKNFGPLHAALADTAFLAGFASWRLRRLILRRPDPDPPGMLADSFRHSVFRAGFAVEQVRRP